MADENISSSKSEDSEDISINLDAVKKITSFILRHKAYLLILIPILITIYIRTLPIYQPITYDWARNAVTTHYRSQISSAVSQQYPNLPDEQRAKIVEQELGKVFSTQGQVIDQQVQQVGMQFRQHYSYDVNGKLYPLLGDLDSYYWLRFARNILEDGDICDERVNGICYDTYTTAPLKLPLDIPDLHVYIIYYLYKIFRIFDNSITLMQTSFLTPLVFAVFSAIFVFILIKKTAGNLGALVGSILISVNPLFLSRSFGSDTDVYNVFFPVIIIWLTVESFRAKKLLNAVIFSALAGISINFFSFTWSGWWYVFIFSLAAIILNIVLIIIRDLLQKKKIHPWNLWKEELIKRSVIIGSTLFLVTGIVMSVKNSLPAFLSIFTSPFSVFTFKSATLYVWPNVLTTVAEFGGSSIQSGIAVAGGRHILALAILGLIFMSYRKISQIVKNIPWILLSLAITFFAMTDSAAGLSDITYLSLLSLPVILTIGVIVWKGYDDIDFRFVLLLFFMIMSSLYTITKGNRFGLLLILPVIISAAIGVDYIYKFLAGILTQGIEYTYKSVTGTDLQGIIKNILRNVSKLVLFVIIFMILVINPFANDRVDEGISVGRVYMPSINKEWVDALTYIKENSKPDAIINSWWDFGHWFKYFADRRVTLDGSSQNNPQLHWLGKLIITDDENMSVGILRMLDCGANTAFDVINNKINFSPISINILNTILPVHNRSIAKEILIKEKFSEEEAEEVLEYTHCKPPEDFYITSGDMVQKSGVWGHFGLWDFNKALMQTIIRSGIPRSEAIAKLQSEFNFSNESANSVYDEAMALFDEGAVNAWISPWPGYASDINGCQRESNYSISCPLPQQGVASINLTTMEADIPSQQGILHPNLLVYKDNESIAVKNYENNTIGIGMILLSEGDNYATIYASTVTAPSIFTRLYYLDGTGLKYYKKVFDIREVTGSRIIVWKIEWP